MQGMQRGVFSWCGFEGCCFSLGSKWSYSASGLYIGACSFKCLSSVRVHVLQVAIFIVLMSWIHFQNNACLLGGEDKVSAMEGKIRSPAVLGGQCIKSHSKLLYYF